MTINNLIFFSPEMSEKGLKKNKNVYVLLWGIVKDFFQPLHHPHAPREWMTRLDLFIGWRDVQFPLQMFNPFEQNHCDLMTLNKIWDTNS